MLTIQPDNCIVNKDVSNFYENIGGYEKAVLYINKVLNIKGQYTLLLYNKAELYIFENNMMKHYIY